MPTIPCVLMRGGTSRGPFFLRSDLPADPVLRDQVLLSVMGSGHELEIDGIGGGHPLTSKIAIVSRSTHPDADVDYLFAQAAVLERVIDTSPNCGNMLAGVGPFAIEAGMIAATAPETRVRIHNVNTGKLIEAIVQTPNGAVVYDGTAAIDGVPGTAAPIYLGFLDAAGAKTGRLLPTGSVRDRILGVEATCIDMAMPMVIMRAADFGKTGHEPPPEFDADRAFFARLEPIRRAAGALMGLGDVADRVIPKPVLVTAPAAGGTLEVRYFTPRSCHRAVAATGAIGIATACVLPGSLPQEIAGAPGPGGKVKILVEHPAGRTPIELELAEPGAEVPVRRASLLRTTRRLFEGRVHVPDHLFSRPEPSAARGAE
ncbi:MAG TPA: 4-oxalomesaconate tautomerase [Geminicoccaceae bacterium]|nr:4-oxalomesaconate tautomerase [Geminicoccaceae bacterium]